MNGSDRLRITCELLVFENGRLSDHMQIPLRTFKFVGIDMLQDRHIMDECDD